jgi:CHAD domain-containing protein
MAFRFELGETFLTGIPRIARERIGTVVTLLNERPQPSAESIHEARKNLKSLRAVLRLASGGIDNEFKLRENLFFRNVGRSLSVMRDSHALIETLDRFVNSHRKKSHQSTPKQAELSELIEETRRAISQHLVDQLPYESLQALVKELRTAKRRTALWFQGIVLQPANEWEILVGTGIRRTYRKARDLVWEIETLCHNAVDDEAWHELRKCAKALGYQLRLLRPIWPAALGTLVQEIDQLTSRLGDANDIVVLRKRFLDNSTSKGGKRDGTRRNLIRTLDRRKQKLRLQALKYARMIYSEKPGQFERRLAGYWRIWRSKSSATTIEGAANNERKKKRNESVPGGVNPELLPVASLHHRVDYTL